MKRKSAPARTATRPAPKAKAPHPTPANTPVERAFTAQRAYADPFNEVVLDVIFTDPSGTEFRVPAFWAGGKVWKVRYASPLAGVHRFVTDCSPGTDAGLHGVTGTVTIAPYSGKNPLYAHGPVRVAANKRHFEHTDGTPFFWLGDTWWMGLSSRLKWPQGFKTLTANRVKKGFNVVQIIAGLYPDMYAFDPRGANEAGFPWEEGYSHIRPEYFDAADKKLAHLVANGISPCIVGAWGYFLGWMTEDQLKAHWRYLIARYAAWPVLWCAGGEANLPWYLVKDFPYDDRKAVTGWTGIMRYVHATDPFHRPLTIHPTAIKRYTARNATDDETLLDYDMLQVCHAQNESVTLAIPAIRETYAATPRMPVLNGEPCYENLGGIIPSPWPRRAFWSCVLNGAMGHTYGGNGIWQCNQPGIPHGSSPHGGNYGNTPWIEAMNYPGSGECGHGKALLTRFDWSKFEPHPEWAAYAGDVMLPLDGAQWIWSAREEVAAKDAPNSRRYFRKTFELPAGKKIASARLRFAGMHHCEAQLNGVHAAQGWGWQTGPQFNDRGAMLKPGRNTLTLWSEFRPAAGDPVPALLACLEVVFTDGSKHRVVSDGSWKVFKTKISGWDARDYDDTAWPAAQVVGQQGDQPWGQLTGFDMSLHGPQSAGTAQTRVTYVPYHEPMIASGLTAGGKYTASIFDPVTGKTGRKATVTADRAGKLRVAPPAGHAHDWVLVLEAA